MQTIDQKFRQFHADNPHVYKELVSMTKNLVQTGSSRVSINMLFEVLRFNELLRTNGGQFKLNNNFRSRYARLIAERNPQLDGVFETRELKAA